MAGQGRARPSGLRRAAGTALSLALLAAGASEAAERPRPSAAALEAARHFLCPHGGTPAPGRRGGRCRAGRGEGSGPAIGWDAGLAPPAHRQAACPEGTVAAAAVARTDAVRCVPQ